LVNRNYELMFILNPQLAEEARDALLTRVNNYLTEGQGELLRLKPWGMRRLAYPIQKYREGAYYLLYFSMPPKNVREFENSLILLEDILRTLIVRLDEDADIEALTTVEDEIAIESSTPEPAPEAEPEAEETEEATEAPAETVEVEVEVETEEEETETEEESAPEASEITSPTADTEAAEDEA